MPSYRHSFRNASRAVFAREAAVGTDTLPQGFDPRRFPILAVHWFGLHEPARPLAEVVDLNHIRLAAALHRLSEVVGAEVGTPGDMLKRLTPRAHEAQR